MVTIKEDEDDGTMHWYWVHRRNTNTRFHDRDLRAGKGGFQFYQFCVTEKEQEVDDPFLLSG